MFGFSVAVLLGADRKTAEKELKESLEFEIKLAHASQVETKQDIFNTKYLHKIISGEGEQTQCHEAV